MKKKDIFNYLKLIEKTLRNYKIDYGNTILYEMCKAKPLHSEVDVINGKIWLIGRAYAAAIERRKKYLKDINDDFYEQRVGTKIKEKKIDRLLNKLRKYENVDKYNLEEILNVHYELENIFYKISGLEKRSLASKYLHFHLPELFFIYDSRADSSIRKIYIDSSELNFKHKVEYKSDKIYADFCKKALCLKETIMSVYPDITNRQLDSVLVNIANEYNRKRKKKRKI